MILMTILAETINGLYKAEVIHKSGPWKDLEDVEYATLNWVDWFQRRILEPIGDIPPAEFEMLYYTNTENELRDSDKILSDKPGVVQYV